MLCSIFVLFYLGTVFTVAVAAVLLFATAVCVCRRRKTPPVLILVAMAILTATCSITYANTCKLQPTFVYCGENISVSGTLADYPTFTNERYVYTLKNCTLAGNETDISLNLSETALYNCAPGDILHFTATKIYPSTESDSAYYFSSLSDEVWLRAYTNQVQIERTEVPSWHYASKHLRHKMLLILQNRLPSQSASVLSALILGNKDSLDTQTELIFRLSGMAHLFAVSGFHVAFWTNMVVWVFGKRRNRKSVSLAASVFLLFFMALTGFSVSVCRAGIMLLTIFFGNFFRRDADSLNSLGLALVILLLDNPFAAADASLLLSAAATAGILLTSEPIEKYIITPIVKKIKNKKIQKTASGIISLFTISFSVSLCILPLTSYLFGTMSVLTPIANLFCMYPAQLSMILGIIAQICNPVPYFSDFLFHLADKATELLLHLTQAFAMIPFSRIALHNEIILLWAAVSGIVILSVALHYKRQTKKIFISVVACACLLLLVGNISIFSTKDDIILRVQDTENASSFILHDLHGNAVILGCGGDVYAAESIQDYLLSCGTAAPRLLLAPRKEETESVNREYMMQLLSPQHTLAARDIPLSADDTTTVHTDCATADLWKNCTMYYKNTDTFSGACINVNGKNIVFCFLPSSDFSTAESCFQSGDILVCRQSLPQSVDPNRFDEIILSADKSLMLYHFPQSVSQKTVSTADKGNIRRVYR